VNSLVVFDNEGWDSGIISLRGERARSVLKANQFQLDQHVAIAKFGGEKGSARIIRCDPQFIELRIEHLEPSLELRPIDLIVGLARPQTTKKVIQAAVMSGVRSLHLVHTFLGEKSYLSSHVLREDALQGEIVKALEQTGEGLYPQITVYSSFRSLPWDTFEVATSSQPLLAIAALPGGAPAHSALKTENVRPKGMVIAVGPEAGWAPREVELLLSKGFVGVGLGPRIVRVELALSYLLGQSLLVAFNEDR
jgi:16S rRNA (uracil1498-N3)-methyltransferase